MRFPLGCSQKGYADMVEWAIDQYDGVRSEIRELEDRMDEVDFDQIVVLNERKKELENKLGSYQNVVEHWIEVNPDLKRKYGGKVSESPYNFRVR